MCVLKGKVALVSGAGQGIGARTAEVLAEAGAVVIVNVSSVAGLVGTAFMSAYNMTKGGVRLFTKSVAHVRPAAQWRARQLGSSRRHQYADGGCRAAEVDRCRLRQ